MSAHGVENFIKICVSWLYVAQSFRGTQSWYARHSIW